MVERTIKTKTDYFVLATRTFTEGGLVLDRNAPIPKILKIFLKFYYGRPFIFLRFWSWTKNQDFLMLAFFSLHPRPRPGGGGGGGTLKKTLTLENRDFFATTETLIKMKGRP